MASMGQGMDGLNPASFMGGSNLAVFTAFVLP